MTKKHFEAMAEMFRKAHRRNPDGSLVSPELNGYERGWYACLYHLMTEQANINDSFNIRHDRGRFLAACRGEKK